MASGANPAFAPVAVDVGLEQHGQPAVRRDRPGVGETADGADDPVEPLGELQAVDRLDDVEGLDRRAGLVRLERAR